MNRRPWELYLSLAGLSVVPGLLALEALRLTAPLDPTAGSWVVFGWLGVGVAAGLVGLCRLRNWTAGLSALSAFACCVMMIFFGFLYLMGPFLLPGP